MHLLDVDGENAHARQHSRPPEPQRHMLEGNLDPVATVGDIPTDRVLKSLAEVGLLVRDARKGISMNQAELARLAGVGRRFVSELEDGKPSLEFDKVLACAGAVGVELTARMRRP